jgi:hypothetical protein
MSKTRRLESAAHSTPTMERIMRNLILALSLTAGGAAAQQYTYLPASSSPGTQELPRFTETPWMRANARVQLFYDTIEASGAAFTATELSLRMDGPIPRVGAPGPFRIDRLRIRIGTTTVPRPGSAFAANLSQPLTTVFDQPVTYWPDQGSFAPEPWGGLNGGLTFAFQAPAQVVIPAGGWLVIELQLEGNNLGGSAHALLDASLGTGGAAGGAASSSGTGCSAGGPLPATVLTTGRHAPGGAYWIHGDNLGANAPVAAMIGLSDMVWGGLPLPIQLPGTACTIYASFDLALPLVADASGSVSAAAGAPVVVPADGSLQSLQLFHQLVSVVPGANPWNLVLSDKRTVDLGSYDPIIPGAYFVAHDSDAGAALANEVKPAGLAVRLRLQ